MSAQINLPAAAPPAPTLTSLSVSNSQKRLAWTPYPAAEAYRVLSLEGIGSFLTITWNSTSNQVYEVQFKRDLNLPYWTLLASVTANGPAASYKHFGGTNLSGFYRVRYFVGPGVWLEAPVTSITPPAEAVFAEDTSGRISGYQWVGTNSEPSRFYRLEVTPMSSNDLLTAIVLNRLAYGPTPDELERVRALGPQAYIQEQLAPWNIVEDVHNTHTNLPLIEAKFCPATNFVQATNASLLDLRAWHTLRAIGARRQLLEILLQFLENHFVTQHEKSDAYFSTYYDDSALENRLAAQLEYLEIEKWRNALLDPQCTFYDLLKVSAESPAMILYLDTVNSRGNGSNIANENYARELLELFTFGVDNGYDQNDITVLSRAWTGWSVEKVDFTNAFNPFAPRTTVIIPGSTNTSTTTRSNLYGVWAFNYKDANHNTALKTIFPGKTVPARFGPPWAGTAYQLVLNNGSGTNGIQDGYQVITHLANQPFTQEYISIKLCRLFVHDDFPNPGTDPNSPAYSFYNYASGNLSPEAQLVRACMMAWETNSPKGQLWLVLKTIFDSDLFRSHSAAFHKVKTPLEFVVSAVRALRSSTNGSQLAGSFTAFSEGYAFNTPLSRMGGLFLFDREAPDGYPEAAPGWISAGTLAERVRFVQSFCIASGQAGHSGSQGGTGNDAGNSVCDIVGLLTNRLPSASWTNAEAVSDYFVGILYPGEGRANLDLYRSAAVDFLNDGSADPQPNGLPFHNLMVSSAAASHYDQRVRGMVGLLMSFPRFQEQ